MLELLRLIPLKDYIYGAVIIAILSIFGWYTHHEREIGRQQIEAKDKVLVEAQKTKNKEIEDGISKGIKAALEKWNEAHPVPPPAPAPRIVCHAATTVASVRPKRGSSSDPVNGAGTGISVSPESIDEGFDPAPAVSSTGTAADTEIVRLKAKVTLLQDIVKAYQNGGLVQGN